MFAALHYRNYRLWFTGQSISLIGMWMQSVAQGWVVYQITGSEFWLGAISFIGSLPSLFLMLPAGVVADRVSRRHLMLYTQSILMLGALILAALAWSGVLQVWHIAMVAVMGGMASAFDAPSRQALAVDMVDDRRDLTNAIALNSMIFNLARVLGPGLGGAILAALGAAWCFGLNGLSYVAVLVALYMMRVPVRPQSGPRSAMLEQIKDGLRYVWRDKHIRTMVGLAAATSMFGMSYAVLLPAFASDVLGVGKVGLGLLNVAMGAGALTGSLMVASMTHFRRKGIIVTVGSLIFPIALMGFGLSRSFPLSLAILVVVGLAWVSQSAMMNTLIQLMVPDQLRGRVMSVYSLTFFGTAPFASLLTGTLAERLGPGTAVAINASIGLLIGVAVMFVMPSLRTLEG